uniref:Uncharacterized protein n=1 Tax=Triticum urartu TaxID=4572 RepID=A0A8R7TTV8_TRIUA
PVTLEEPDVHRPARRGLLLPDVDVAVGGAGVEEAPSGGAARGVADRERVDWGQLGAEHDDEGVRGAAVHPAPHLDGAVGGAREDAAVGLVDEHGINRPIVGDEGIDAAAVGELPRLDGVVVRRGVEEARNGVEHEARHGVAVV